MQARPKLYVKIMIACLIGPVVCRMVSVRKNRIRAQHLLFYQVTSWSIQPFGHNTPTLQTTVP